MYKSVCENIVIIRGYIFKRSMLFTKLRSPTFSISYFFLAEEEVSPIRSATSVLKAEAKRRHQHELLVEKLGYDPDDVKHNSKRYTKSRKGTRRRQGNKRHPAGSHRAASPLRAAATTATRASGRAPKARAQRRRKPGIVSQYNQRALRPDLVKKPVALTPFVDADTGEALTPNNIGLQSPRDQVKARRHEIGPPVVIESIGDLVEALDLLERVAP